MKPINLFSTSTKSRSANVSAQKRLNCYLEKSDDTDSVVAYGMPGCTLFTNLGELPIRGIYQKGDYIYTVHRSKIARINQAGIAVDYALNIDTSTGHVDITDNGTQILFVDGTSGYILTLATNALTKIVDADYPVGETCAFNTGLFIINEPNTGKFWISASYDGTSWDATNFATAESHPDNLLRVFTDHGQVYLFGEVSGEVWVYTGALDFPYSRLSESTFEWGLAARWSLAKFDNSFIWLAKNSMGEVQVCTFNGGTPTRISNFDIESIFNGYTTISDATGFTYMFNGHPFYHLNFPTEGKSWLYDGAMQLWSQLKSSDIGRHRYNLGITAYNKIYTTDYANGNIYIIDRDEYTENGDQIEFELITKHLKTGIDKQTLSALQVDMETGVGAVTGQGNDPRLMLTISRDNGHTWGNETYLNIGALGNYKGRARRTRLGQAREWVFRLRITDPIKRIITGLYIS
jgi:hypothetical protein